MHVGQTVPQSPAGGKYDKNNKSYPRKKARNPVERDHLKSFFFAKKLEKNTKTNWE